MPRALAASGLFCIGWVCAGDGRIAQSGATGVQYFLGNAPSTGLRAGLGSVRQLVDVGGEVLLAQSYEPYGGVLESVGDGESSYGFTAEIPDPTD